MDLRSAPRKHSGLEERPSREGLWSVQRWTWGAPREGIRPPSLELRRAKGLEERLGEP